MYLKTAVHPGKPQRLLPPATAMFSMPDQRLPTGSEREFSGTVRQTCGLRESGKSMWRGSFRVRTLPLMATISFSCIVERHCGTTFCAAVLAEVMLLMLGSPGAPVEGPFQVKPGC